METRIPRFAALGLSLLLAGGCAYFQDTQSQMEEAELALSEGDDARAESLYREVSRNKDSRDSDDARRALASLLLQRAARTMATDPDAAMPIYRDVVMLEPNSDEPRIAYGRALMKVERFTEAIDVLMENRSCRGCKTLISVIYLERGNASLRDGEYASALEDYDLALDVQRDPRTVLAKLEAYIQGSYGSAEDATAHLDQALRLMPPDQVGVHQVWWDKRQEVVYHAALRGEDGALNGLLALADPRARTPASERTLDLFNLRMYAASLQIYMGAYEAGTTRGVQTFADAERQLSGTALEGLRGTLLGLYMQRVAAHIGKGEHGPAAKVAVEGLKLDEGNRVLNMQLIVATAMRNSGTGRKMLSEWSSDPEYGRVRALVETAYARKMIGVGQFSAARTAVERAERYAPGLLETHLTRAELQVETRVEDLRKSWVERFREIDQFAYPKARIAYYGQASAELAVARALYTNEAARDYLRGPEVGARLEALEQRISAFYPYRAEPSGSEAAVLVLTRHEGSALKVSVQGPRKAYELEIPENGQVELSLAGPGLAVVETSSGVLKAVFGEPKTKITIAL